MSNKYQLELNLEIRIDAYDNKKSIKMRKYLETGFIPQHGMEIIDSGIIFRVKSIALAGLQDLKHIANPDYKTTHGLLKYAEDSQDSKTVKWLNDKVNFLKNQGWSVI